MKSSYFDYKGLQIAIKLEAILYKLISKKSTLFQKLIPSYMLMQGGYIYVPSSETVHLKPRWNTKPD